MFKIYLANIIYLKQTSFLFVKNFFLIIEGLNYYLNWQIIKKTITKLIIYKLNL